MSRTDTDSAHHSFEFTGPPHWDDSTTFDLWPKVVRFEGGFLAGLETTRRTGYSGGGASSTTLRLIAFVPDRPPFEVLEVPLSGFAMIRACFSEQDMKQRAGACHDEYTYKASIALAKMAVAGWPVLRYRSQATSFPGRVSRVQDSLKAPPLRRRDIVTAADPRCSYRRRYEFSPDAGQYVPDTPPPDCSDYMVP